MLYFASGLHSFSNEKSKRIYFDNCNWCLRATDDFCYQFADDDDRYFAEFENGENHDQAQDIADSMMEYLQWKMKSHEAGWNTGKVVCGFGSYKEKTTEGGGNTSFCQDPGMLALANPFEGQAQKKY